MFLNKKIVLIALASFGYLGGIPVKACPEHATISSQASSFNTKQRKVFILIHDRIERIVNACHNLIHKFDNPNDPDLFDTIVLKMESIEPVIKELAKDIAYIKNKDAQQETGFYKALQLEQELLCKIDELLIEISNIIRCGMKDAQSVNQKARHIIFGRSIKQPLEQIASSQELAYFKQKLTCLHGLLSGKISDTHMKVVENLLSFFGKIHALSESKGNTYKTLEKIRPKLPKTPDFNRAIPFEEWA